MDKKELKCINGNNRAQINTNLFNEINRN